MSNSKITLYFLQASRSIRIAWLLEELHLDYKVFTQNRNKDGKAPDSFKKEAGTPLGKFPVLVDGDLKLEESGSIVEYLIETYDKNNALLPLDVAQRAEVRKWIHASEATFMIHGLAILYARINASEAAKTNGELEHITDGMAVNVKGDLDWLEGELKKGDGKFLVGGKVTAADIMMEFTIDFILGMKIGTKGGSWPGVEKYLKNLHSEEGYKKAVQKTGHTLFPA